MARHEEIEYAAQRLPGRPRHEIEAAIDRGHIKMPADFDTRPNEDHE